MPQAHFMVAALQQARAAQALGEVPVGAVVVLDEQIIGEGHNRTIIDQDPSAHAEIVALRAAGQHLHNHRLTKCDLYVTLEPCVMCAGALLQARIRRLIFAAFDAREGAAGSRVNVLDSPLMNHRCAVHSGILKADARRLLKQFFADKR